MSLAREASVAAGILAKAALVGAKIVYVPGRNEMIIL